MPNSFTADTHLSSQMKKPGEKKGKNKRNPKIHTELTKFYIHNKYRTVILRKMKLKIPSLANSSKRSEKKKKKKGKKKDIYGFFNEISKDYN